MLEREQNAPAGQQGISLIRALEDRQLQDVISRLSPTWMTPDVQARVGAMAGIFPAQGGGKTRLVGYQSNHIAGAGTRHGLWFETAYPGRYVSTTMTLSEDGTRFILDNLDVRPIAGPLEKINAFTLSGRGPVHHIFLFGSLVCPAITIAAVVRWRRNRGHLRRKWLWLAGILLGVGKLGLNWTTGQVTFSVVHLQLLSAGFQREGAYGPWWLFLSVPIGTLVFLARKGSGDQVETPSPGRDLT
jgi:hypothetical protein